MHQPDYILERHPHGWLIKAPPHKPGVPANALQECTPLLPPGAVFDIGIAAHHNAIFALVPSNAAAKAWREEIEAWLAANILDPLDRWLQGTHRGASSEAIVFALTEKVARPFAAGRNGDTPHDAGDFGRCERLLDLFPDWRARLPEVAAKFPNGHWPKLVPEWENLRALDPFQQTARLRELTR